MINDTLFPIFEPDDLKRTQAAFDISRELYAKKYTTAHLSNEAHLFYECFQNNAQKPEEALKSIEDKQQDILTTYRSFFHDKEIKPSKTLVVGAGRAYYGDINVMTADYCPDTLGDLKSSGLLWPLSFPDFLWNITEKLPLKETFQTVLLEQLPMNILWNKNNMKNILASLTVGGGIIIPFFFSVRMNRNDDCSFSFDPQGYSLPTLSPSKKHQKFFMQDLFPWRDFLDEKNIVYGEDSPFNFLSPKEFIECVEAEAQKTIVVEIGQKLEIDHKQIKLLFGVKKGKNNLFYYHNNEKEIYCPRNFLLKEEQCAFFIIITDLN